MKPVNAKDQRILLGIDADLSPPTQYALQAVCDLIAQASLRVTSFRILLLNVIPITQIIAPYPGMHIAHIMPLMTTSWQRNRAEDVLRKAGTLLKQQGIPAEQIEQRVRVGVPADEITRVAREEQITLIVIGNHGNSFKQQVRRFFLGSISHRLLNLAPCPVMLAIPPTLPDPVRPTDLVAWYKKAIMSYLNEHAEKLAIFTPLQVIRQFAPPGKRAPNRKEIAAATLALEQLANDGVLCRHDIQGELRYVND